jgi:hypothetical protein
MLAAATLAAFVLAGCVDREQVVFYEQGKYEGKPDQRPWENASLTYGDAKWTQGDAASWEQQIKRRALHQNEYIRIVH